VEIGKMCENTPPFGRHVSTQFLVFPISTRVDITVYQHGKCFIFVKYDRSKLIMEYLNVDLYITTFTTQPGAVAKSAVYISD
jgi:hypothetical protein